MGDFIVTTPDANTRVYTSGKLPVSLTPGNGKITVNDYAAETGTFFYYYTTSLSPISAPAYDGTTSFDVPTTGAIWINGSTEITGLTNGVETFVQVYKLEGIGAPYLVSFGEVKATPVAAPPTYSVEVHHQQ